MRTKAEVLEQQIVDLEQDLQLKKHYLEGLKNTPCNIRCSGCGKLLESEYDFAAHFIIPDERYLNLGECPLMIH